MHRVSSIILLLLLVLSVNSSPIWKVFCGGPLFRGRIDPIVNPGAISGHSHKVFGGNHFSAAKLTSTPLSVFEEMMASTCTTCSINQVDMSAYWHPDLYYRWPNGTFSMVPDSGLTVYYLSRSGSGNQSNPQYRPIPKGLRMLAGHPMRRHFDSSILEHRAIDYVCLNYDGQGGPNGQPNNFPTDKYVCKDGIRAQVFFPMCWDGKNLDSADHKSHMAYPSNVNGGNCPWTHPVRIPGIFMEALYSTNGFPHGTGTNPFVWSNGDPTGYGLHADFLGAWDEDVMQQALLNPACDNDNPEMAFGNNVKACPPLAPYVQNTPGEGVCNLAYPIPLTEDLGIGHPLNELPGCNPLTYGPEMATMCSKPPSSTTPVEKRFHLRSKLTKKYVTVPEVVNNNILANGTILTLAEIFSHISIDGTNSGILSELFGNFWSANGDNNRIKANRGNYNGDWERFQVKPQGAGVIAIIANRNGRYISVQSDNTIAATATAPSTDAELFETIAPNGGNIGTDSVINTNVPTNTVSGTTSNTGTGTGTSTTSSAGTGTGTATGTGTSNTGTSTTNTVSGSIATQTQTSFANKLCVVALLSTIMMMLV